MKAYEFIEEKEIKELETMARGYEHKKTGARIFLLLADDVNLQRIPPEWLILQSIPCFAVPRSFL